MAKRFFDNHTVPPGSPFMMMMHMGYLRPGSTVLIHSAAGGVGIAAIQLAKLRNCTIIGLASKSKHDFLRSIGVQVPLENVEEYAPLVRAVVGDKGVDLILDPVGGKSWTDGYELLGPCGRLCAYGISSTAAGKKTISGCNMAHLYARLDILSPQFDELLEMYVRGEVRPHVDRTFSFDEAAAAHHYIHDRKAVGKVVLVP
jgi:NADPH:quinone reductase-like Zn-dependent oxidoreductase